MEGLKVKLNESAMPSKTGSQSSVISTYLAKCILDGTVSTSYEYSQHTEFVCVEVLKPSQPNGIMSICLFVLRFYSPVNPMGLCRVWSVYLITFTGQAKSSKRLTSIVHILSPETDNCPS